jgi:hypothetical protein
MTFWTSRKSRHGMRLSAKLLKEYLRLLALADDQLPCNPAYDEDKVVSCHPMAGTKITQVKAVKKLARRRTGQ